MIWFALLISFYAFFELFNSTSGLDLAVALFRLALACNLIVCSRFESGLVLAGMVFLTIVTVTGAFLVIRKEVQFNDDQR